MLFCRGNGNHCRYGNEVMELDLSVGQVMQSLCCFAGVTVVMAAMVMR